MYLYMFLYLIIYSSHKLVNFRQKKKLAWSVLIVNVSSSWKCWNVVPGVIYSVLIYRRYLRPSPAKMMTLAKAATRSLLLSSHRFRSMWMSLMFPAQKRPNRWSNQSKRRRSLKCRRCLSTTPWPGSGSPWLPLMFHQQWMSALVCLVFKCHIKSHEFLIELY